MSVPMAPPIPIPPAVPLTPPQGPQPYFGPNAYVPQMPSPTPYPLHPHHTGTKFRHAFYAAVLFFLLSHPIAYRITNQLFGIVTGAPHDVVGETGCTTLKGAFLHAVLFFGLILLMMMKK